MGFIAGRSPQRASTIEPGSPHAPDGIPIIRLFCCIILLLAVTACQVRLVSGYDEATDRLANSLEAKIDNKFQSWIRMPAASTGLRYDDKENRDFYSEVSADISVLESRAKAQPSNQTTISMIETIKSTMDMIEALHKEHQTVSPAALQNAQDQIDFEVQRLISFELAKKRDDTPKS
jgi:hypothetical protein